MSGNNYSLKQEAKILSREIKGLSEVQQGFIIALYFGESVDEGINSEYPDQSLLDECIPYDALTQESITNIKSTLQPFEEWLQTPKITELYEKTDLGDLDLGYYLYMHSAGHGVSIDDDGSSEFTERFCQIVSYNPPWTVVDFDEKTEEYQVDVNFG